MGYSGDTRSFRLWLMYSLEVKYRNGVSAHGLEFKVLNAKPEALKPLNPSPSAVLKRPFLWKITPQILGD